jgi:hypothetical protein
MMEPWHILRYFPFFLQGFKEIKKTSAEWRFEPRATLLRI